MSNDAFLKSLQTTTAKDWDSSRKTRDPFAPLDVPDGTYHMRLTSVKLGVHAKEKYPQVTFMLVLTNPEEYKGLQTTIYHGITKSKNQTVGQKLERLFQDLQKMGLNTDDMKQKDLPEAAATLTKQKPLLKVSVSMSDDGGMQFKNIQGLVEGDDADEYDSGDEDEVPDADIPPEDDEEDIDVEPDEDAAHDDDDSGDDNSDDDAPAEEEAEPPWQKGDACDYKPPRGRKAVPCTVKTSNKSKRTATLKRDDSDKEYKDVSWDDLLEPQD